MKHNYLKNLFTALLLLCTTVATAHDFEVGGIYYNILSEEEKTVEVTYGTNEYIGSVVIPESVIYGKNTYSVTSIGNYAFASCSLASVDVSNTVTSIGDYAFNYCSSLEDVRIGNGVTSIGKYAFYKCSALTNIQIPSSVKTIGWYAFQYCGDMASIAFGSGLESVGYNAFQGTYIEKVVIDDLSAWCSINFENAQANPMFHSEKLYLNGTVIRELDVPNDVTTIGSYAFYYFTSLTSITIPDNVISIGAAAFGRCSNVKLLNLGNGLTNIGNEAFLSCSNVTEIIIPEGVTYIGASAFSGCTSLISITIPNTLETVGADAFRNTSNSLKRINISDIAKWCKIDFANEYANPMNGLDYGDNIYVNNVSVTKLELPNDIVSIGNYAFYGAGDVLNRYGYHSVVIPEGVTYIGDYALYGFEMSDVDLPNNLETIGSCSFYNCRYLRKIKIPATVTYIGDSAFSGCSSLESITSEIHSNALFQVNANVFNNVNKNSCTLYVPYGAKEKYSKTKGWSTFTNIEEILPKDVSVVINQYGSATYCSPFALDFSEVEDLKAYAATGYNKATQVVTLTRLQTAQEGTGIFLMAEPGEYTVPVIEYSNDHTLNLLVGTLESTIVNSTDGAMSNYKFTIAEGNDEPMFYPFEDGTAFSAGKAYLQIPTAWLPVTAQKSLNIRFDEGETTDIDELKGENGKVKTVYDLQGRVVENPTSGIYIIDGKKVIIK